jgi:hypothetical protein
VAGEAGGGGAARPLALSQLGAELVQDVAGHVDVVPGDAERLDDGVPRVPLADQLLDVVHVEVLVGDGAVLERVDAVLGRQLQVDVLVDGVADVGRGVGLGRRRHRLVPRRGAAEVALAAVDDGITVRYHHAVDGLRRAELQRGLGLGAPVHLQHGAALGDLGHLDGVVRQVGHRLGLVQARLVPVGRVQPVPHRRRRQLVGGRVLAGRQRRRERPHRRHAPPRAPRAAAGGDHRARRRLRKATSRGPPLGPQTYRDFPPRRQRQGVQAAPGARPQLPDVLQNHRLIRGTTQACGKRVQPSCSAYFREDSSRTSKTPQSLTWARRTTQTNFAFQPTTKTNTTNTKILY